MFERGVVIAWPFLFILANFMYLLLRMAVIRREPLDTQARTNAKLRANLLEFHGYIDSAPAP